MQTLSHRRHHASPDNQIFTQSLELADQAKPASLLPSSPSHHTTVIVVFTKLGDRRSLSHFCHNLVGKKKPDSHQVSLVTTLVEWRGAKFASIFSRISGQSIMLRVNFRGEGGTFLLF
jgi:hypothetical protein